MLFVGFVRHQTAKIISHCRILPLRSWCSYTMPEEVGKREAGIEIEDTNSNSIKRPRTDGVNIEYFYFQNIMNINAFLSEREDEFPTLKLEMLAKQVASEETVGQKQAEQKWKLKKFAMCLSYCGKGYLGLQRNPGFKTIEEDLLEACFKAGVITEDNLNHPRGISFQRAARTDKGVSAARQIISLKLPTTKGSLEQMVENINKHLVDQIRVIGLKRVTKHFNAKNNADARTYLYICPTFAFTPSDAVVHESFRLPPERVVEINNLLKLYLGSHNFHNFTSGKPFSDPSSKRYIVEIECGMPFKVGELEYVQFRIRGQSFMLHQIRKMVGVIIGIMRGYTTADFILRAFGPVKLDVPKAPPLGLMLDTVHYSRYDNRYGSDGSHETITWEEYQDVVHNFKTKYILPNVWDTEEKEESMFMWLEELALCSFDLARGHESVPKNIQDAPDEDVLSDDEPEDDEEGQQSFEKLH